MIKFLPYDSVVCFTVQNRSLHPKFSEEYNWIPNKTVIKPIENWGQHRYYGKIISLVMETFINKIAIPSFVKEIVSYAKMHQVDRVWAVLQGQTMIRLAIPVAKGLDAPLYTGIYDPPGWWMRANNVHPRIARDVIDEYERILRFSRRLSLASWAMVDYYKEIYGVDGIPMVSSLESDLAIPAANHFLNKDTFTITMAGQLYANNEWHSLLNALNMINWKLDDRKVILRYMGGGINLSASNPVNIHYLGWCSQNDILYHLSNSDIAYCPYWFDPAFEMEARLSFPSKLTLYLASGRPVLFHGPSYSSPATFLTKYDAAYRCHALDSQEIIKILKSIIRDEKRYSEVAHNGRKAFDQNLTIINHRQRVQDFFELS